MSHDFLGLARTFYPQLDILGHFTPLAGEQLPQPQRDLLDQGLEQISIVIDDQNFAGVRHR